MSGHGGGVGADGFRMAEREANFKKRMAVWIFEMPLNLCSKQKKRNAHARFPNHTGKVFFFVFKVGSPQISEP